MGEHEIDAIILDAVQHVRDRFGAPGLRDLMEEARRELVEAESALDELGDYERSAEHEQEQEEPAES